MLWVSCGASLVHGVHRSNTLCTIENKTMKTESGGICQNIYWGSCCAWGILYINSLGHAAH